MFYIYEIPGIKVGCTSNIKRRVKKQQGYKNYKILYITNNILEASEKEMYFQKKMNYKCDKKPYYKTIIIKNKKMYYTTQQTVTLKGTNNKALEGFEFPTFIELDETIELNTELINWIKNNNFKSKNNEERFFYREAFMNYYEYQKKNDNIFNKIRLWADQRGIYEKGDPKTQFLKLQEETGELAQGILKQNEEEVKDAIGDCVVVLTNLAFLCDMKIEDCINSAYSEIKARKGKMKNGTFVKE